MKKPILIEIDGPEGASKSTLIGALQGKASPIVEFKSATSNWKFCRLPGTSKLGEYLRPVVKEFKMLPQTSLGIALAGMSDAYQDMINSKCNIVVDRGLTSVLMYQFNLDGAYKANPILAETIYDTLRRQVEDAFDYYEVARKLVAQTTDNSMKGYVLSNTADACVQFKKKDKALKYYAEAVRNYELSNSKEEIAQNYKSAAELMIEFNSPNKAKSLLKKALVNAVKTKNEDLISEINTLLVSVE